MTNKIKWNKGTYTEVPELPDCDVCKLNGGIRKAKYDSKMKSGRWAFLCPMHFELYGSGLGYGKGQMLVSAFSPNPIKEESNATKV